MRKKYYILHKDTIDSCIMYYTSTPGCIRPVHNNKKGKIYLLQLSSHVFYRQLTKTSNPETVADDAQIHKCRCNKGSTLHIWQLTCYLLICFFNYENTLSMLILVLINIMNVNIDILIAYNTVKPESVVT